MAQCCEKKAEGLLTCCDSRKCLPLLMFTPQIPSTRGWFLYECHPPIPNPNDLLKILPAFFMKGVLSVCVIDLDSFIQQIFVQKLMFCICWMSVTSSHKSNDFLSEKSIPDCFVLSPFSRSQFQVVFSRSKYIYIYIISRVTEYSFGQLLSRWRTWHVCLSSLEFNILNLSFLFFLIRKTPLYGYHL